MKLNDPKEIVKSLRLYLDIGDELLSHLLYVDSYDALHACVMEQFTAPSSHPADVKIIIPDLKRYDLLLKGGDSVLAVYRKK